MQIMAKQQLVITPQMRIYDAQNKTTDYKFLKIMQLSYQFMAKKERKKNPTVKSVDYAM